MKLNPHQKMTETLRQTTRQHLVWGAAALGTAGAWHDPMLLGQHDWLPRWLQWLLATPVQFFLGWRFYLVPGTPRSGGTPIWMCWLRSALPWPGCSAPLSG